MSKSPHLNGPECNRWNHGDEREFMRYLEGQPLFFGEYEELSSSDAAAVDVDLTTYETKLTTGGSAGSEDVNVGDGSDALAIGQRKLITLDTRTDASDVVNLDHANIVNASGVQTTNVDLDAEGEFVLLEWNGAKWQIIYSDATVAIAV